jgi:hypothetical protein
MMTTRFPDLLGWQYSLEGDNHAIYQRHGWTIHCWDIDGEGTFVAELWDPEGGIADASPDGDVHWLAQSAAELDDES